MSPEVKPAEPVTFQPVTPESWPDLEKLFGPRGAVGGCWCMWFRHKGPVFEAQKGEGNRQALQAIVAAGEIPGILAFQGEKPVGWCSVAPREVFPRLDRSRILKRVDDQPVWSVVCFFIARGHRRQGLGARLLQAAVDYAAGQGARIIEGYPVDPKTPEYPGTFAFTGLAKVFRAAGFQEVARRSDTRPIMRLVL